MKVLTSAIVLFVAIYAAALALQSMAVGAAPREAGLAWHLWQAAGSGCLSSTAVELTLLSVWLWQRSGRQRQCVGVPLRLAPKDRNQLAREAPPIALLMPAHKEATTPEDREALVARIDEILARTPEYSTFFLLADSPADQADNEHSVIRQVRERLRASGRSHEEGRIILEEYRDKPPAWRHKCGSLLRWMQRYSEKYEFMFVLDADSSLAEPDAARPQTCDVIERMLLAMRNDPTLALVQSSIEVRDHTTGWGWIQAINARIGSAYYFPAFASLYGRSSPCYGHNCLMRVRDFMELAKNTLSYTSHDHIDSADLAAAGRGCILSDAVVTLEQTEETLPGWLKRECRWSRGNGQWLVYLLKKRPLPLGVTTYLTLGILQYVWTLLATIFFVAAAVLIHLHPEQPLVPDSHGLPARLLIGLVLFASFVPKLLATRTLGQFLASTLSSLVLGPTIMLYQGICFLMGAFGTRWVPRGARTGTFDLNAAAGICAAFFPAMLLGIVLSGMVLGAPAAGAALLVIVMGASMALSPLTGLLLSCPLPGSGQRGQARDRPQQNWQSVSHFI